MKWIVIDKIEGTGKTKCFNVRTLDRFVLLGRISFYSRWREYAFFPYTGTLYEADCLRDIAQFCEDQTKLWRKALNTGSRGRP